jgi:nucleoside-diphosphate-sugar epimerase
MYLLTGATGLVGSEVLSTLGKFDECVVLSRSGEHLPMSRTFRADIADELPHEIPFDSGVVIHCAAEIRSANWDDHWATNVAGTRNLLQFAVARKARRFIFISTGGVYQAGHDGIRASETDLPSPRGPYAHSKMIAEDICRSYGDIFGLEIVIFRLYFPYANNKSSGIFSLIEKSIRMGQEIKLNNWGLPRITPVALSDAIAAIALACQSDFSSGTYNLCGNEALTFLEIVRATETAMGKQAITVVTGAESFEIMGANTKLKSQGWSPKASFSDYLKRLDRD